MQSVPKPLARDSSSSAFEPKSPGATSRDDEIAVNKRLHRLGFKRPGNAAEGNERSAQVLQREKPLHQRHPSRIGKGLMPKKKHSAITTAIPTIRKATVRSYADPYVDASVDLHSE